ncbi:Isocitrate dehydrogenase 2 [Diplonema papillatum]|nr:Isocitrate dehydrogenase 2 [Diplonema papillatum]|eukprot:gene16210-24844_t
MKIIYTHTDEAPMLATFSLLPVIQAFTAACKVPVETRDISLAGRILATFPDKLKKEQIVPDHLAELGELAKTPDANIIKLPNISASIPQLQSAIAELQSQGYNIPTYPETPQNAEEAEIKKRYSKVLGSAVNPVLREGNSDRRVAAAVKQYAKKHPHSMGKWSKDTKTHVSHMDDGDFYASEKSYLSAAEDDVKIEFTDKATGATTVLKESTKLLAGEIIDAACMSSKKLKEFFAKEIADAKARGLLFSLHLKATMMKVSDPIMFGQCVEVFFKDVFDKHAAALEKAGADASHGLGAVLAKVAAMPDAEKTAIEADFKAALENGPDLAMVDSRKGITNLHVPSDVIIDASMPAMIRASGQMWNKDDKQQDTKCCIPDRCYAGVFAETINFCRENGAFDPSTMGTTPNVGLMAQKAEEYGSHDKTFKIKSEGTVKVTGKDGKVIFTHDVAANDIWRMCQVKDAPIRDWVKLAVSRARATKSPALFWLDTNRAHDRELIKKAQVYLKDHDTSGLDIRILTPVDAVRESLRRAKDGKDTISVTGNVLRDYLTDLFPILELGTSAKMLSIVPLLAGGGLFETGAGGSAPKHVQQFVEEDHLRWDSLGEFLALAVSLEDLAEKSKNAGAKILGEALNTATAKFLDEDKSPSRKAKELDNRGSHYYLAMYWAEALAAQNDNKAFKDLFAPLARGLQENEKKIVTELNDVQGKPIDIKGYFHADDKILDRAMRPSQTLNSILASFVEAAAKL